MAAEVGNASDVYATLGDAWRHPVTRGFRYIFYIASPAETSFEQREDVPDYVNAVRQRDVYVCVCVCVCVCVGVVCKGV